jgi:hypothetical protein
MGRVILRKKRDNDAQRSLLAWRAWVVQGSGWALPSSRQSLHSRRPTFPRRSRLSSQRIMTSNQSSLPIPRHLRPRAMVRSAHSRYLLITCTYSHLLPGDKPTKSPISSKDDRQDSSGNSLPHDNHSLPCSHLPQILFPHGKIQPFLPSRLNPAPHPLAPLHPCLSPPFRAVLAHPARNRRRAR